MSWDLMIFNSNKKIDSIEDIDESQLVPLPFSQIFTEHFTNTQQDGNIVSIKGDDYSINYFEDEHPAGHKLVSIIGEKGLLKLVDLAKDKNWQIFDLELGEMINLNNPERNGFKNFKEFVQQVATKNN